MASYSDSQRIVRVTGRWLIGTSGDLTRGSLGQSNKTEPFEMNAKKGSIHIIGTGTPTGTPKLFASSNWIPNHPTVTYNGNWEDVTAFILPAPGLVAPAGADFTYLIGLSGLSDFGAFYFDYAYTSGAGEASATWILKD